MKTIEELKKEQYDAKAKLHELIGTINSEEFYNLSATERGLINQQRTGIEMYLSSLTRQLYGREEISDANNLVWLSMLYGMMNTSSSFGASGNASYLNDKPEGDPKDITLTDHAI